jgi:DNA-binding FadR family transcriptional regulator
LQASGLVETRHGIGTFVIERAAEQGLRLNVDTALGVRSILELRMGLETQAAALAAQRRSEQQLLHMRQALDDYQRLLDSNDSCVEADRRFHLLIAEATGNVCFSEIMQHLGSAMIPRQRLNAAERGAADLSKLGQLAHLEHEAILNAIKRQTRRSARGDVAAPDQQPRPLRCAGLIAVGLLDGTACAGCFQAVWPGCSGPPW